jgi:hypothetical protein
MRCESESTHFRPRTTPNFQAQQRYRGPDPGCDADFANDHGANGKGIRLSAANALGTTTMKTCALSMQSLDSLPNPRFSLVMAPRLWACQKVSLTASA